MVTVEDLRRALDEHIELIGSRKAPVVIVMDACAAGEAEIDQFSMRTGKTDNGTDAFIIRFSYGLEDSPNP